MGEIADDTIDRLIWCEPDSEELLPLPRFDDLPHEEKRIIWHWTANSGKVYNLYELSDSHITNIIPFLERRKVIKPEVTKRIDKAIKLLKEEQKFRKRNRIIVPDYEVTR